MDADSHAEDEHLRRWVGQGLAHASSLPPKERLQRQRTADPQPVGPVEKSACLIRDHSGATVSAA